MTIDETFTKTQAGYFLFFPQATNNLRRVVENACRAITTFFFELDIRNINAEKL